jgi:elongation factor Tu
MTGEDGLLLHLRERPEDALARLAYADWLDEHGRSDPEAALAEWLRLEVEHGRLAEGDPRRPELQAREEALLQSHGRSWRRSPRHRFLVPSLFSRTKAHVNVGAIGHVDHGKSTLTAALVARSAFLRGIDLPKGWDRPIVSREPGHDVRLPDTRCLRVEYETEHRHYAHADCPGHVNYTHNMLVGAAQMDAAILVVSADDGPRPQTRDHLLLAATVGVPRVVVFLNKVDLVDDPELIELVEMEVRELLNACQFPGDEVPIVRGSALAALRSQGKNDAACRCIDDLMNALDRYVPTPERLVDWPFLMSIEDGLSIKGCGTVATGRIERGRVKVGDEVEIVGLTEQPRRTVVTGVEMFNKTLDHGEAGESVGVLLRGIERGDVKRGQVLARPGSVAACRRFEAQIHSPSEHGGGRRTPFFSGYRPQFYFRTARVTGTITLPEGMERFVPGDYALVTVDLHDKPVALTEGMRFAVREGGRTIATGVVTRILDGQQGQGD